MAFVARIHRRMLLDARRGFSNAAAASVQRDALALGLYRETPLVESAALSDAAGFPVLLKLDCLQPSGSFKDRGMANLCLSMQRCGTTKLVSSSGGNAGLACATVGKRLGMAVDVIVPETTKAMVVTKLQVKLNVVMQALLGRRR